MAGPTCPFCRAPWTPAMLDLFDRQTQACSCNGGTPHRHDEVANVETPVDLEDICCAACGRALYLAHTALG